VRVQKNILQHTPSDHLGIIVHSPEICNNQAEIIFNVLHLAYTHRLRKARAFTFTHKTVAEAPLRLKHTHTHKPVENHAMHCKLLPL